MSKRDSRVGAEKKSYRLTRSPRKIEVEATDGKTVEVVTIRDETRGLRHANDRLECVRPIVDSPILARGSVTSETIEDLSASIAEIYLGSLKNPSAHRPFYLRRKDAIHAIDCFLKYAVFGWTVEELARIFDVSERSIERAIQKGSIHVRKYGERAIASWVERIDAKKRKKS